MEKNDSKDVELTRNTANSRMKNEENLSPKSTTEGNCYTNWNRN